MDMIYYKMKYQPYHLLILVFLSCNNIRSTKDERAIKKIAPLREKTTKFINNQKFKVEKQSYFSLKDWDLENRESRLTKLNKEEVKKYFQAPLDSASTYNTFYYFSIQEYTPKRKSITIIESDESCCSTLYLLTFNENNKLVGKSTVAGSGGDGGWGYDAYGKFDSDSTFYFTHVESETIKDDSVGWEAKVDSLVVRFSVDKNLNLKQKSQKKFEYNKTHLSK